MAQNVKEKFRIPPVKPGPTTILGVLGILGFIDEFVTGQYNV